MIDRGVWPFTHCYQCYRLVILNFYSWVHSRHGKETGELYRQCVVEMMPLWCRLTWRFIYCERRREQEEEDWVTVEGFRRAWGSFIHHPQSLFVSILTVVMQGRVFCLCWGFFSFQPSFTVNKSCPVLARRTCHRWRLPFHRVCLENNSCFPSPLEQVLDSKAGSGGGWGVSHKCCSIRGTSPETKGGQPCWSIKIPPEQSQTHL